MESYMNSWEGIVKDYQNFSRNKNKLGMKNSLELEADGEKIDCKEPCGDSLPIHCIVQTFSALRELKAIRCEHCHGKTKPVDCWWECNCEKNEVNDCIVLPRDTSMSDLVRTALVKLGYPASTSSFATGSVLIRNWKPLPLEVICHDMKKTVGDVLGEITAVVSLRIQIFKPKITAAQKMKDSLLLYLINMNQSFLRDSRCPFDMTTLSKFCDQSTPLRLQLVQEPAEDLLRKFDSWLEDLQEKEKSTAGRKSLFQDFLSPNKNANGSSNYYLGKEKKAVSPPVDLSTPESNGQQKTPPEKNNLVKDTLLGLSERPKHFLAPKTRVRTSFDPEFELPKLQKWFLKNPHPSRQQIYEYVSELNSLESRKGRKQLDVNNVVYWFKNARAAQKRTECRRFSNTSTPETNRCNLLKIPLGKTCGVTSDDQRSISEDEGSITSESGDDYRQEKGRCLQVVGKWNSNGQGEAVLEMQIPSRKNEFPQSGVNGRKEKGSEGDIQNEGGDHHPKNSETGNCNPPEKNSECESVNSVGEEENVVTLKINKISGNKNIQKGEDSTKTEVSPKVQTRTTYPSFKENGVIKDSDFLSSYKTGFAVTPNSVLNSSFICMPQYIGPKPANLPLSSEERRKRNRTFIDPVTEVPRLEQWFRLSTHPSHNLIARYTEELNNMPYRRKFPKLEAKNVQFWFKNRRAKNKRLHYLETNNN